MGFQEETVSFGGVAIAGREACLFAPPIGSGVTLVVFDPELLVGGMAHLPFPERGAKMGSSCDHRVESLIQLMCALGAETDRLQGAIIGAAEHPGQPKTGPLSLLAQRSLDSARSDLSAAGVKNVFEDVGGEFGRSCFLGVADGKITVTSGSGAESLFLMGRT